MTGCNSMAHALKEMPDARWEEGVREERGGGGGGGSGTVRAPRRKLPNG